MELNCLKCGKKDENIKVMKDVGSLCDLHFIELRAIIKQFIFVQPDRSKREDLHHKDCIPIISNNCWHVGNECELKEKCDRKVGARMRCSEHCGNTVREVQ
jgi:hypothetical protein